MPYNKDMESTPSESGNFIEDAMSKAKEMGLMGKPENSEPTNTEMPKLMIGDEVMEGADIVKFVDDNRDMLLGKSGEESEQTGEMNEGAEM